MHLTEIHNSATSAYCLDRYVNVELSLTCKRNTGSRWFTITTKCHPEDCTFILWDSWTLSNLGERQAAVLWFTFHRSAFDNQGDFTNYTEPVYPVRDILGFSRISTVDNHCLELSELTSAYNSLVPWDWYKHFAFWVLHIF